MGNASIRKIICTGVMFVMILGMLCACNRYNAVLFDDARAWMKQEFLEANPTKGLLIKVGDKYIQDQTSPSIRDFIIDNQTEFEKIFNEFPPGVDFEKEMIVVHIFTTTYNRDCKITKSNIKDGKLQIVYKMKQSNRNDATEPWSRCFAVKMERKNINSVEFVEKK